MCGCFRLDGVFIFLIVVYLGDLKVVDEFIDVYDIIDWFVKYVFCNIGKVGMWGIFYFGFVVVIVFVYLYFVLKVVSLQVVWNDYWIGDDFYCNGVLWFSYVIDWFYMFQYDKIDDVIFDYGQYDIYDFFLKLGFVENFDMCYFKGSILMFMQLFDYFDYDVFYIVQCWIDVFGKIIVLMFNVVGYWDQEDLFGFWLIYCQQERNDFDYFNIFVVGFWSYGYWSCFDVNNFGCIFYGVLSGQ